ncbi:hypothetical protein E3J49_02625 [Candidatus Bathyarchaeota archaeon]|nr:MAG: hypothetical protein E3J49_02625 [Candidatus Bathyarchaeota archaeon]
MSKPETPYVRNKTCPEEDISSLIGEQNSGDPIHMHPPPHNKEPKQAICPLLSIGKQFPMVKCKKEDCEWWMAADDECAIYRIARCIL